MASIPNEHPAPAPQAPDAPRAAEHPGNAGLTDVELGRAFRHMLEAHHAGQHVNFLTGDICAPEKVSTHVSTLTRYVAGADEKLYRLAPIDNGVNDVEYVVLGDVQPLLDAAEARGRAAARELAARLCDHYGHNWSAAPALAFFECATQIREETPKYLDWRTRPSARVASCMFYMRENHTFRRLSANVEVALAEIAEELDAGWKSGTLASNHPSAPASVHAMYCERENFLSSARKWLEGALEQSAAHTTTAAGACA